MILLCWEKFFLVYHQSIHRHTHTHTHTHDCRRTLLCPASIRCLLFSSKRIRLMISGIIPSCCLVLVTHHLYSAVSDQDQPLVHQSHILQDTSHSWRCDLSQARQSLLRALLKVWEKTLSPGSWELKIQ